MLRISTGHITLFLFQKKTFGMYLDSSGDVVRGDDVTELRVPQTESSALASPQASCFKPFLSERSGGVFLSCQKHRLPSE